VGTFAPCDANRQTFVPSGPALGRFAAAGAPAPIPSRWCPPSKAVRADRTGVVLTALSAAFFGSLAIYGKFADRMGIPLTELLAIRFGLAAVILWGLALLRRERLWWGRRSSGLVVMGLLYLGQAATSFTSLKLCN
jgi:hypothetical protein